MQLQNASPHLLMASVMKEARGRIAKRLPLTLCGLQGGSKAWLLSALASRISQPMVVVCDSLGRAETLCEDLDFFNHFSASGLPALLFPHWDTVPYDSFSPHKEGMAQRFTALASLMDGERMLLVTTRQALMQGMMPPQVFRALRFGLRRGESIPRAGLLKKLAAAGYVRVDLVEAPGEFSARGGIVDVFSIQEEHPVRLDFFDNDLDTIRYFEVSSQKSFRDTEAIVVFPASEVVVNGETADFALRRLPHFKGELQPESYRQLYRYIEQAAPFPGCEQMMTLFYERAGWLFEAFPQDVVLVVDEPDSQQKNARGFFDEVLGEQEFNLRQGNLALDPETFFLTPEALERELARFYRVRTQSLRLNGDAETLLCPFADNSALRLPGEDANGPHPVLEEILARLVKWRDAGARLHIAARTRTSAERLRELMAQFDVGVRLDEENAPLFDDPVFDHAVFDHTVLEGAESRPLEMPISGPGKSSLEDSSLEKDTVADIALLDRTPNSGFRVIGESGETHWALITEEELLGEKTRQRRLKKGKLQHFIASLGDLKEGQLVVHVEYGIGRYEGLRRLEAGGDEGDFLHLSYAGGDKVYVPVSKLNLVQKFTGVDDTAPQLNRLGDAAWQRSKTRASKAIEDMAGELIATHAQRKAREGHPFPPNRAMMTEFEEAFPYQETEDQETAIQEVLDDLSGDKPMDRLVCGDVGFGKTEVAMRAAYLAVLDGFQVMMLVPTTILAQQHFETFNQRFERFPVNIEVISRFRTPTQQKKIVKRFAGKGLDILIGTHRLLSKDIAPGNLGLLIIDEEQRFGVAHKEKIKRLKTGVEVLTLSATPIPRTLHMSLMGVRDLSIINTAPMDRIAVRTRLVKAGDYIITEAIEREVRRGGQVFVVENRVEHIHAFGTYIQSLLPNLRLAIAHGQMPERQLEEVMLAFVKGEIDVLVSTSIIESGLDIPRANTILIHHADRFGLAQLYQLRGRVGRSNVQAYAYLLVSPEKALTEVAQKRLNLLQELNDLGSGFKIASHDLEIRGAGNLVGREQSGHISNIGLELFTRMVEEAVGKLQDGKPAAADRVECKLELGFPYLLPETYIPSTRQRLDVYKQLAEIRGEEELWEMRETLEDRFGKAVPELASLFVLIQVRLLAMRLGLSALENQRGVLSGRFGRPEWVELDELMALVNDPTMEFKLQPGDRILMGPMPETPQGVLERLAKLEPAVRGNRAAA